jgi:hypothetical protein
MVLTDDGYVRGIEPKNRGPSMKESPILIHIWDVDPAKEGLAAEHLDKMFGEVAADPGFVSGKVFESADRASIAAFVEMQSVEDRQRLEQLAAVREALDHLPGTVNVVLRLYHEVGAYQAK